MGSLTDAKCRAAKGGEKPYKLFDANQLYLFVSPSGGKSWRMNYKFDGKEKTLTIGRYPVVGLADAREKAIEAKRDIAAGRDPALFKSGVSDNTFKAVAETWFKGRQRTWQKSHSSRVWSRLERDVFPMVGMRPVGEIEPPDVLAVVRQVESRGAIDVAKQVRQSMGQIFRFAIAEGKATRDPAADIKDALLPKPKVQHHSHVGGDGLVQLFKDLYGHGCDIRTRHGIELSAHVFLRTQELLYAHEREFELDRDDPIWRVPADRMKKKLEHIVPLTPRSRAIIGELMDMSRGGYLFPGRDQKPVACTNVFIKALYDMGYKGRQTVHGFRGLASTVLNESGLFASDWIERQLAHVEGNKVRAAYNSAQWLKQRAEMMVWWSEYVEGKRREAGVG
jgi:integrase